MRKAVLAAIVLFAAANLFAATPTPSPCNQPNLLISGIQGEMQAPCTGALDFTSASFSVPSTTGNNANGSGAGTGSSVPGALKISRYFDKASPALMTACLNGTHFQKVTLSYPSAEQPVTITFENVIVASLNENFNPTNESVEFKYTKFMAQSGNTKVTGSVMGGARASAMNASVIGSDGKSHAISHLTMTVRPGGTTFDSVQLAPPPPGNAAKTPKGGLATKVTPTTVTPTTAVPVHAGRTDEGPEESMTLNYGRIEFKYQTQTANFNFTGGTVVNGNLRTSRASFTGASAAVHPR